MSDFLIMGTWLGDSVSLREASCKLASYKGRQEEVDCAETREEAETLLGEYRLAFGPDWVLEIQEP